MTIWRRYYREKGLKEKDKLDDRTTTIPLSVVAKIRAGWASLALVFEYFNSTSRGVDEWKSEEQAAIVWG
jgi:hypothetical protein